MEQFDIANDTHRRYNPLIGEWMLVSPHRGKRPWLGQQETPARQQLPEYDTNCYLCPGNERAGGVKNPQYRGPFVFTNDFSAITPNISDGNVDDGLFQAKSEKGICRVICFSPYHNKTIPQLSTDEVFQVVKLWQKEYVDLGAKEFINHIQIFENKGAAMGCSNPHPHCQIWAQQSVPEIVTKEDYNQKTYYETKGTQLLQDYVDRELEKKERIVFESKYFVALVPFWATWPFEIMILPKHSKPSIASLNDDELYDFSEMYRIVTCKYDNLFQTSFPYSAGVHQAPTDGKNHDYWTFHMHFYPPLFRSATVKKFMVGYEMLAEPQRDITAEQSAERLRQLGVVHYTIDKK
ncbi:MAG: UDP-glucose--hexose-1-phosphate uridylyltransferase [Bacteroidales bacterium]|nr:UDP-glucose--hexose-1-phosphate uridylyltransferase [Bacteroidales bacterium]